MRAVRILGNGLLWIVAVLGALSGALKIANAVGYLQPVIVVSGSMSPGIRTGDLLIDEHVDVAQVKVGDVVTLPSTLTGDLVTHRVIEIEQRGTMVAIRMQGDANASPDAERYLVPAGGKVWRPAITVPRGGSFVTTFTRPMVAVPLLVSILALIALAPMSGTRKPRADRSHPEMTVQ